jgi:hypothetical protein
VFGHVETAFVATRAEQHLADGRATKLGPLFAEAERKPAVKARSTGPQLSALLSRVVHQLRSATRKGTRNAADLQTVGSGRAAAPLPGELMRPLSHGSR